MQIGDQTAKRVEFTRAIAEYSKNYTGVLLDKTNALQDAVNKIATPLRLPSPVKQEDGIINKIFFSLKSLLSRNEFLNSQDFSQALEKLTNNSICLDYEKLSDNFLQIFTTFLEDSMTEIEQCINFIRISSSTEELEKDTRQLSNNVKQLHDKADKLRWSIMDFNRQVKKRPIIELVINGLSLKKQKKTAAEKLQTWIDDTIGNINFLISASASA